MRIFKTFIAALLAQGLLAAPLLASIKLIGNYVWRKMFDLPPFSEEITPPLPPVEQPPPEPDKSEAEK